MLRHAPLAFAFLALSPLSRPQSTPAAPQTWTLDGPAFATSASDLQSAAAKIHSEPDSDITVLFEEDKRVLTSDGRSTTTHRMLYRIETKAGVEDWNETAVDWDPWYQNQPTIRARVIQPDGRISDLDPKTLTDVPAKNEQDGTFSDARIHKAPLPSIAIGAIVEDETVVQDKLPFFSGGSIYRVFFSRTVPVLRSRLIIEVPADAPFQSKLHSIPDSVATTTQAGNIRRVVYDLYAGNNFPVPLEIDSDINLPTDQHRNIFVEFSTGASWASVATAYQKLAEPQIQPDHIKSLLPASLPTGYMESVQALVSRLHKEIRYTGIEFGESALQPQNPTEILKRHYGDCKDKAAFLVAMLRASGIPANLALLQTGPGPDVNPDLPGMNEFDHAIVHVPAGPNGRPELWIDATAEFTHVGDLPYDDKGRLALIIADGTSTLTRTPDAKPEDSILVETRDFTMKQFGPAHIVESSATTGYVDADYRYRYGATETKAIREDLEAYSKRAYSAKALTKIEHPDGSDLTKSFTLRLDIAEGERGTSSLADAAVAIPPAGPYNELPSWFSTDPDRDNPKPTPEQFADRKKAEAQRASEYLIRPFISEWHYHITLPEGFQPRSLPEDKTITLGPATLTRHFEATPSGSPQVVNAVFRFNSAKSRYTVDEALALRKALLELNRQDYILLAFDQIGAKLVAAGKIRDGLTADRALIAAHPAEPLHHVQMAAVLLNAGLGEQAQVEARRATTLDPRSAISFLQLGIALERNNIGIQYGRGFDRAGAIEAYRKAKLLEPENTTTRFNLAVLYEHNAKGERYTQDASLADAIREYRGIKEVDKDFALRAEDNILYAMFYNRDFKELINELAGLPSNATRDALAVSAVAASQSPAAAIKRADAISGDADRRAAALRLAGFQLMRLNLYAQSSELLSASIHGEQDAAQISRQVEIFRDLKHAPPSPFPATDPRTPVQLMLTSMMESKLAEAVPAFMDRHAFASDAEWKKNLEHNDVNIIQAIAQQSQLPVSVMSDVVLGNAKLASEGDETHGYRITMQSLGTGNQNFFVSHDEGKFKIIADSTDSAEVGNYALYLLANKRETEAASMLDWKRDAVHRGGGDDPLEGDLFARFWTVGGDPNPASVQIAALALTLQKPSSQAPLTAALAAYAKSPDDVDLTLLLACAYANHRDSANTAIYLNKLLVKYPTSLTAITMMGQVYDQTKDYAAWRTLLDARLAKRPTDHDLLIQSVREAEAQSDFARARATYQKIVDSGKATSNDYNGLAWLALFDDHVDAKAIEAAQQSNAISKNANFGDLHTLACLYAAQGKAAEARELLLKAMAATYSSEPNPEIWFGFASIYQQFGLDDDAITAYKKVPPPDEGFAGSTATYTLAQARLKLLHAN